MIELLFLYIIFNIAYFLYFNLRWSNTFIIVEERCGYRRLKKIEEIWLKYRGFWHLEIIIGLILLPALVIILIQRGLKI